MWKTKKAPRFSEKKNKATAILMEIFGEMNLQPAKRIRKRSTRKST